jgi:hypothetical protein
MPRRKVGYFTKLDPEILDALRRYRDVVGVPIAVTIHKALVEYLSEREAAWPVKRGKKTLRTPTTAGAG